MRKNQIYFLTLVSIVLMQVSSLLAQDNFGGLALYTLRDDMASDPQAILREVAETGYAYVEAAGYKEGTYYGMKPEEFKASLNDVGLQPVSTHQPTVTLENADQLIADAKAAGFKYFVIPIPPMGHFKYDRENMTMSMTDDLALLADVFNTIGKKCKDAGLELLYHNHDFEYKANANGVVPIEYFLDNCNPEYVNFQMDLYWVTKAGADPVEYFKKYPGRFKMWHVKDMDDEGRFAPVGTGNIDFKRLLDHKEESGMEYYLVEQDNTFDTKPLDAIKTSHKGLVNLGFH